VAELVVATLNIRNIADRWPERLPLLVADMAALQPDVIGLQEVVFAVQQDRLLGAAGAARYRGFRGWAGRPEYGNAILVKELGAAGPAARGSGDRLDLGLSRSALRIRLDLPGGVSGTFVVTHLHHLVDGQAARDGQVRALLEWLADAPNEPLVVVGDFNADPAEPAYARMVEGGFRSAHAAANGAEPPVTWPSGIQAPGIDDDGEPGCLDYVWLRGPISVESCRLVFDRPAIDDPTLYPSDHFGLAATLRIGG
jgi:endonuclease/exonuclease/phosphatase family metal-dependent hydrolase